MIIMPSPTRKAEPAATKAVAAARLPTLIWRALRLHCPACGRSKLFRGWFAMHESCSACGRPFHGDAGYYLGSIYFNYGVTGMSVVVIYFTLFFGDLLTNEQRLALLSVFVVLFPIWFFRYARSLWLAVDELFDPWHGKSKSRDANVE
jgi:uncharacterized protein (DUF983 family)